MGGPEEAGGRTSSHDVVGTKRAPRGRLAEAAEAEGVEFDEIEEVVGAARLIVPPVQWVTPDVSAPGRGI